LMLYISTDHFANSLLWRCWLGCAACKNRPRNDPLCVGWDVKPVLIHSFTHATERYMVSPKKQPIPILSEA